MAADEPDLHKILDSRNRYRLRGGKMGTEYEAVLEAIADWEQRKAQAERMLNVLAKRLVIARREFT